MDIEEKREVLKLYQKRCEYTSRIEEKIEDLTAASALRSVRYDGMPRSRKTRDLSDWVEKKEKMEVELHKAVDLEYDALKTIEAAAEKLPDHLMRHIIRARYIELKDIPTIAKECGMSERNIWRYHTEAIRLLEFDEGTR